MATSCHSDGTSYEVKIAHYPYPFSVIEVAYQSCHYYGSVHRIFGSLLPHDVSLLETERTEPYVTRLRFSFPFHSRRGQGVALGLSLLPSLRPHYAPAGWEWNERDKRRLDGS